MTEKIIRKRPEGQMPPRMLGHGMDPMDYFKLMGRTEKKDGEDFVNVSEELGDKAYNYAVSELEKGHTVTAYKFFMNASALYRIGDYGLVEKTEEKLRLYKKVVDSFERGKALSIYDKPIKLDIPYLHSTMPGWLMIPEGAPKDVPVAIVIPGATGYKEENYAAALKLWERGGAALVFDGPGQGEALLFRDYYYDVTNYEKAVKTVMDFVRADTRVGDTIGLYGISYGGYLAPRAASFYSDELACAVGRGGSDNSDCLIEDEAHIKAFFGKFKAKLNIEDDDKAMAVIKEMNIIEEAKNITCPLLLVHTENDFVVNISGVKRMIENVSSEDKELKIFPGGAHCADDDDEIAGSYIADWMKERLMK